ncbi:MAG TPA: hypothetical protein VH476_00630 [Solirubrobacterales bacterium]|jgi:hypothetical protein
MSALAEVAFGPRTIRAQVEERIEQEVIAAGHLRQGRTPSMASMITGTALIELFRPRQTKTLPKSFVLAVTPARVVAFAGTDVGEAYEDTVVVRGEELGSWPRGEVSLDPASDGRSLVLTLAGEQIAVFPPNLRGGSETDELIELLSGYSRR